MIKVRQHPSRTILRFSLRDKSVHFASLQHNLRAIWLEQIEFRLSCFGVAVTIPWLRLYVPRFSQLVFHRTFALAGICTLAACSHLNPTAPTPAPTPAVAQPVPTPQPSPNRPKRVVKESEREPERVALVDPKSLIGLTPGAVERLLGSPAKVLNGTPSLVWTYAGQGCTFMVVFYPELKTESFHALKYSSSGGEDSTCLRNILTVKNNGPS